MSSDEDWGDWDKRPPPAAIPCGAAVVSSFGFEAPAEKPSSADAAAVPGAALREKRSPAGKAKASASASGAAPKAEPNVRSAKGRPVHFGPQTCHVTQLRQRQRKRERGGEEERRGEEKRGEERGGEGRKERRGDEVRENERGGGCSDKSIAEGCHKFARQGQNRRRSGSRQVALRGGRRQERGKRDLLKSID